jgi:hypothetical protein
MSARPARTAQGALRELLGAMSDRQLALAAREIGVSRATLTAFASGRSTLPDFSLKRLGEHLYAGRYFVKQEETEHGARV